MEVSKLVEKKVFTLLTNEDTLNNNFNDVYIGDLLSWVMGNGKPESVWLTVLSHMNIIAVAALREFRAIIICEGAMIQPEVIERANEEKIAILSTSLTSFEVAKILVGDGF